MIVGKLLNEIGYFLLALIALPDTLDMLDLLVLGFDDLLSLALFAVVLCPIVLLIVVVIILLLIYRSLGGLIKL